MPPRAPWRQLVIACLLGVLIGAAPPAALQAADRTAAEARVDGLRSTALAYLSAIAAGDAQRATAMVPVSGHAAPDAVLRSADPITDAGVRLVMVDEAAGAVEVAYRIGSVQEQRTLSAAWTEGEWRLTTSLSEPVTISSDDASVDVRVGGVELPRFPPSMLYPGRYAVDETSTSLLRSGGEPFEVDGDPESRTELVSSVEPSAALRESVLAIADAQVEACQLLPDCPIGGHTAVAIPQEDPYLLSIDPSSGSLDVLVPLGLDATMNGRRQLLHVRAVVDGTGEVASWECGEIDDPASELAPCDG